MKNFERPTISILTLAMIMSLTTGFSLDLSQGQWIDLSHEFSKETIYWPTADTFNKSTVFEGTTDVGYYYCAYNYTAAEHGGTHLDAPIHFYEGRHTVEQIPIDRLVGNAVVIDVSEKAWLTGTIRLPWKMLPRGKRNMAGYRTDRLFFSTPDRTNSGQTRRITWELINGAKRG